MIPTVIETTFHLLDHGTGTWDYQYQWVPIAAAIQVQDLNALNTSRSVG